MPSTPLEQLLGHSFTNPALLTLALTHRSHVFDGNLAAATSTDPRDPSKDNEQLEFLGDAALGLLAAEALYRRFPTHREGELTQLRASVISRKHLGAVGTRLGLAQYLVLGRTAEPARANPALLSNAVEALIAALYLDGGLEAARQFVEREILLDVIGNAAPRSLAPGEQFSATVGDHKSALQEMLQAQSRPRPEYRLLEATGPDHQRLFRVAVFLEAQSIAEAEGPTKKLAQQTAARLAVAHLMAEAAAQ